MKHHKLGSILPIRSQGKVLAEYTTLYTSTPSYRYIYAGDQRIAMRTATGQLYFYLNDHLGSVAVVVDSVANVKDFIKYRAYGQTYAAQSVTGQKFSYTGHPLDEEMEMDLHYAGARYYDGLLGAFCGVDARKGDYESQSPFIYALNEPLGIFDPDGRGVVKLALKAVKKSTIKRLKENARRRAVRQAWKIERARLLQRLDINMILSGKEKKLLLERGSKGIPGWQAHHINSVAANSLGMAADPRNIMFVKGRAAHFDLHSRNWQNSTFGPLIDRTAGLTGGGLLSFFLLYDEQLNEFLAGCPTCSDDDSWLSYVNPFNSGMEGFALLFTVLDETISERSLIERDYGKDPDSD